MRRTLTRLSPFVLILLLLSGCSSTGDKSAGATAIYGTIRNKIDSPAYAVMIAIAVFVNLGVWLMEQFVSIDFEILSVSYIISECFLLGLHFLMVETEKHRALPQMTDAPQQVPPQQEPLQQVPLQQEAPVSYPKDQEDVHSIPQQDTAEATEMFLAGLAHLTPKERQIYDCYISGWTTDVIMETLCIKENTLKFHNKNLYSKLGVKSRKQLVELHKMVSAKDLVHP